MPVTVIIHDRIEFCSRECMENALAYHTESLVKKVRVSDTIARVLQCYGCGLHLDEAQG